MTDTPTTESQWLGWNDAANVYESEARPPTPPAAIATAALVIAVLAAALSTAVLVVLMCIAGPYGYGPQ